MIEVNEKFEINYVDPSSLSAFNRCPAKYMLSRLMGLNKPDRMRLAMDYGTDIHESVPYCYDKNTVEQAISIFTENWEKRNHPHDDKRNVDCAAATLYEFTNSHSVNCPYEVVNMDITAPTQIKISKNEIPFLIDIGGPLALAGRIDTAVRWKADKSLWALDYKTSGEVSARLFNNFENCPQALGYTLALSQLTNERVRGLIVEVIRVSKKNAESQMKMVFVKDHQLEHFINFANRTSEEILECNEKQEWPMKCSGCSPYAMFGGAGYLCDYLNICDSPNKLDMMRFFERRNPFHPYIIKS